MNSAPTSWQAMRTTMQAKAFAIALSAIPNAEIAMRRVTRWGVRIRGVYFSAPELADLLGADLIVVVPKGLLLETLHAYTKSRSLILRSTIGGRR